MGMGMTHLELFHGLVAAGMKMRYGNKPGKAAMLRVLWEKKHIIDADYVDYYLMAFGIFHHYAKSAGIGFWARGAMNSSIVCFCLGLTEVDPIKYGLHSARFVNDELPKFQFDIEASRYDEFMKGAEEVLQANAVGYDISAIKACLFKEDVKVGEKMKITYLTPCEYLSRKHERPLPENIDDELAHYALFFPQTMDLYEAYVRNPSTFNRLIYQEQMLDILRESFHVGSIKANQIRLAIQREETEQVEAYRQELFANLKDITPNEAETAWQRLTSNPRAFLKAHAVSRVMAKYMFEF
jgi:DNA polymerase III alpha subunit